MRTIKFRGKIIDSGEWVYGNIQVPTPPFDKCFMWDCKQNQKEVISDTVGQFTGLYDKNKNEIYEGDIVRVYVALNDYVEEIEEQFWRVGIIRFTRGQFALTQCTNYGDKEMKTPHRWSPDKKALYTYPAYRSEIIGNIHDNPIFNKD